MDILDLEETHGVQTYHQVCPAVIVSLETLGAAVAREVLNLVAEQWAGLPIVQSVQLETADADPKNVACIISAIQALHQLELVHAVRRRGGTLRHLDGLTVFVLLPRQDGEPQRRFRSILAALRAHFAGINRRVPTMIGIFLSEIDQAHAVLCASPCSEVSLSLDLTAFNGGCYVVETSNIYGLTFADHQRWISMIANWIFELLTTPLGSAVAGLPYIPEQSWSSFGLAQWRFPTTVLLEVLIRRWQIEILAELVAARSEQQRSSPPMHLGPVPNWQTKPKVPPLRRQGWSAWPSLSRVTTLHTDLDAKFKAALAQLNQAGGYEDQRLDHLLADRERILHTEVANILDTPRPARLDTACQIVRTARSVAEKAVSEIQGHILRLETQLETAEQVQTLKGQILDRTQEHFPQWTLRAWLGVLGRPWRWPQIVMRYLQVRRAAQAYLEVLEHVCLLRQRIQELAWQTAYWCQVGEILAEVLKQLATFRRSLGEIHAQLTAVQNHVSVLHAQLEAASLPPSTFEHLYERGYAQPQRALDVLLGTSPQLSDYVAMREGPEYLLAALGEQARERFEFIEYLHLDQLLMRTYRGAELRARLNELLQMAGPFCVYDRSQFSPDERANVVRTTWLGLPDGEASPLIDLVNGDHLQVYGGGSPDTITAVQVITGLRDMKRRCLKEDDSGMQCSEKEASHE